MFKAYHRSSIFPVVIAVLSLAAGVAGSIHAGRLEAEETRTHAAVPGADWRRARQPSSWPMSASTTARS